MSSHLRLQRGGSGRRVLVLLHGLGASGDVWGRWPPVLARRWPGRWLAPDLPGHGGGLVAADDPMVDHGLRCERHHDSEHAREQRWRLAIPKR